MLSSTPNISIGYIVSTLYARPDTSLVYVVYVTIMNTKYKSCLYSICHHHEH